MENPFFNRDINEICAICLNAHGYNGTSSLLTMLPVEEPVAAYKVLESMSQFKYTVKGPQYLCSNCFQMASFLNAFQRMCNKAQWYFDNYIRYQNESTTNKAVFGQVSNVSSSDVISQNNIHTNNLGNSYGFLDNFGLGQSNRQLAIENVICGEPQSSENNCIFGSNNTQEQKIRREEMKNDHQSKKMRLLQYSSEQTKPAPSNCQKDAANLDTNAGGNIGQENSNDSFGNNGDFMGETSENDDDIDSAKYQATKLSTGRILNREKKSITTFKTSNQKRTGGKKSCRFCYDKFKTYDERDEHEKNVHTDEKTYTCELCKREFYGRKNFHMHQNRHKFFHLKRGIGTLIVTIRCPICKKRFITEDELKEHEGTHTADKIHKCHICSKMFTTARSLGTHVEKHKDSKHTCPTCKTNFVCVDDLKQHIDTVVECKQSEDVRMELLESLRCQICSVMCNSTAHLKQTHRLTHEKSAPVTCHICNKQLTGEFWLKRHMRARHGANTQTNKKPIYKCEYCDKTFMSRTYLHDVHYRIHESIEDEANVCRFCGKTFFNKQGVRRHELTHTGVKNYKCNYCAKRFATLDQRVRHHRIHVNTKSNLCNVCGNLFKGEKYLMLHVRKKHPAEFEEQTGTKIELFPCDVCGKKLRSEAWLGRHKREEHSGTEPPVNTDNDPSQTNPGNEQSAGAAPVKPEKAPGPKVYKCELCSKVFRSSKIFLKHKRVHRERGEGPTCKICGKLFGGKHDMLRHEKTHNSEKNYKCDYCDKHFATVSNRTQHHRVHLVTKSNPCLVCGKLFKGEDNLKLHMRDKHPAEFEAQTGTKIEFYSCNICHKKLRSLTWLDRHKREAHPKTATITGPRTPRPPRRPQVEPVLHKCELCSAVFKSLMYFQKHQRVHDEKDEGVKESFHVGEKDFKHDD